MPFAPPGRGTRMRTGSTSSAQQGARILPRIPAHYRRRRGDSAKRTILFLSIFLLLAICLFASVARGADPALPDARRANERFRNAAHPTKVSPIPSCNCSAWALLFSSTYRYLFDRIGAKELYQVG